ncbi:ribonuclease P protein subunit p30-like isoform X2 [Dreissena polymorpha]|uniref:ribonuclease P protein subunit p30-like isoform X2 n=1 Tax=Dreissena polymorpha TaxID=45954 RepID=UPI0022656D6D|nr:ribonuclease P protein subunit p30-like isoform X2 [Dreissena polymorpha]
MSQLVEVNTFQNVGYKAVAINIFIPELTQTSKKKKSQQQDIAPAKSLKLSDLELQELLGPTWKSFRQLTRISATLADVQHNFVMSTDIVQQYDLVAVQPTTDKTFYQACTALNVDIITLDVTEKLPFKLKRTTINAAVQRGIKFEFQYSPAIRDSTLRKYFIANAQQFVFCDKGKNIILTSGCEKAMELRGPYDVANLGSLLNLNAAQSKAAVTLNCEALLKHSESRRLNKSVSKVEKLEEIPGNETWLLDKLRVHSSLESVNGGSRDIAGIHGIDSSDEETSVDGPAAKKIKLVQT